MEIVDIATDDEHPERVIIVDAKGQLWRVTFDDALRSVSVGRVDDAHAVAADGGVIVAAVSDHAVVVGTDVVIAAGVDFATGDVWGGTLVSAGLSYQIGDLFGPWANRKR